jgi:hypothetical protein
MSRNWIGLLIGALVLLVLLVGALGLLAGPAWGWGWRCPGCPMMGRWGWGGMGWGFGLLMMLLGLLLPLLFFGLIIAAVVWGIQQVTRAGGLPPRCASGGSLSAVRRPRPGGLGPLPLLWGFVDQRVGAAGLKAHGVRRSRGSACGRCWWWRTSPGCAR